MKPLSIAALVISLFILVGFTLFLFLKPPRNSTTDPQFHFQNPEIFDKRPVVEWVKLGPLQEKQTWTRPEDFGKNIWSTLDGTKHIIWSTNKLYMVSNDIIGELPVQGPFINCGAMDQQEGHWFAFAKDNVGVLDLHSGDVKTLSHPNHAVLTMASDPEDNRALYVTYVDELNRGVIIHYVNFEVAQIIQNLDSSYFDMYGYHLCIKPLCLTVSSVTGVKQYSRPSRDGPWVHQGTAFPPNGTSMLWGYRTVVSDDLLFLAISSPFDKINQTHAAGQVYVFSRTADNLPWSVHEDTIQSPFGPRENAYFGIGMYLFQKTLFITEGGDGGRHLFQYDMSNWTLKKHIAAKGHGHFGTALSYSVDTEGVNINVGLCESNRGSITQYRAVRL